MEAREAREAYQPAGRPRVPDNLRIIQGQGQRRDGQWTDSGGRPVSPGVQFEREAPAKPAGLSPDADWLWDRVVDQMAGIGLLKPIDGPALENLCETFARWREAVRYRQEHALLGRNSQGMVTGPWIGIEERASKDFRAWCAEFGITPAAERNIIGRELRGGDDENPF